MKPKLKLKARSYRDKQPGIIKTPIPLKGPLLKSACRDEIVWTLYGKCRKTKNGKSVKIYLQNVDFPVSINYKKDFLEDLKRKRIIKNYKVEIEEKILPPAILKETLESNLGLLPFISFKDIEKAPKKYSTVDYFENDYVAIIECNPQTVLKRLKKNFSIVDQKRNEILKREEIETFFKKEQTLGCNELRFGLESGNAIYRETLTNFKPGKLEYILLRALMERLNKKLDYSEIRNILNQSTNKGNRDISFIIRNIKQKLEIIGPNKKNKDLFRADNGYMIVCG